jgi:hypothetical protein
MAVQAWLHTRRDRRPVGKPLTEHGGEPLQMRLRIADELWEIHFQQRDAATMQRELAWARTFFTRSGIEAAAKVRLPLLRQLTGAPTEAGPRGGAATILALLPAAARREPFFSRKHLPPNKNRVFQAETGRLEVFLKNRGKNLSLVRTLTWRPANSDSRGAGASACRCTTPGFAVAMCCWRAGPSPLYRYSNGLHHDRVFHR